MTGLRKRLLLVGTMTTLLVTVGSMSWASANYNSSKSNVYKTIPGFLVTATASLSGPSDTQTVYTTPATGNFIVTEVCSSAVTSGVELDVTGFGGIAQTTSVAPCYTFTPGVVIGPGATMTCSTGAAASPGSYFCRISGIATGVKSLP
jgi:hypothetical protein